MGVEGVSPAARPQPTNRMPEFDVFRGFAALSVLIFHYTYRFNELYGHAPSVVLTSSGPYGGIDMFFVMTGFLIYGILGRTPHGLDFVVSRVSRLYPAYWAAVACTFAVVTIFGLPDRGVSLLEALVNLSMLSVFLDVPYVDGVYWTLSLDICFYAIMLALYQFRQLHRIELISALWLGGIVAVHALGVKLPIAVEVATLSEYGHLFIAGIIIYRITQQDGFTFARGAMLVACVLTGWYIHGLRYGILDTAIVLIVFATTRGWLRWIALKPLMFLGSVSYSLFLLHQNIGYVILRETYAHGLNPYIGLFGALALMLAAATLITYYIELPAMRLARQWYKRFRDRLIAAPKIA